MPEFDYVRQVIKALLDSKGKTIEGVSNDEYQRWITLAKNGSLREVYFDRGIPVSLIRSVARFNTEMEDYIYDTTE